MSEKHDDGGPAFPMQYADGAWSNGMSLLDRFALELAPDAFRFAEESGWNYESAAGRAYDQAAAMLSEKRRRESAAAGGTQ